MTAIVPPNTDSVSAADTTQNSTETVQNSAETVQNSAETVQNSAETVQISIESALNWAQRLLADVSDTPRLDAECLLADSIKQNRTWLYTWPERLLTAEQWRLFQAQMMQRQVGQPVAYLLGYREFWGLNLKVSPDTLIPRPDTEDLVAKALELLPQTTARIADLGTGTGAIALALAHERPHWQLVACDVHLGAIALAEANRQQLALSNVTVMQSDWCQALQGEQFDLIISNPPYIEDTDPHLNQGDVRFEPRSALTSGQDGLDAIRTICQQAPSYLKSGGWLLLEHGYRQGAAVRKILCQAGYQHVTSSRDLAGQERMTQGRLPALDLGGKSNSF